MSGLTNWLTSWLPGTKPDSDVLMQWDDDKLTMYDSFASLFFIGSSGSGKSTSQRNIERRLYGHKSRPGGVIVTVKEDECARQLESLATVGRLDDVILLGPDSKERLNAIRYDLHRRGGSPDQLSQLLDWMGLIGSKSESTHGEAIWQQQSVRALRQAIETTRLAGYDPSPQAYYDCLIGAPVKQLSSEPGEPGKLSPLDEWRRISVPGQMLATAAEREKKGLLSRQDRGLLLQCKQYWEQELPQLGPDFRGSVVGVAVNPLTPFLFPPYSTVFASGEPDTFTPEDVLDGKVIIFHPDWSVLVAGLPAQVMQAMIVRMCQMACMRRPKGNDRPVFFVRDEVGHVIGSGDWEAKVLSVSRSHRMVHLDAVQDMNTLYTCFGGGPKGQQESLSWLANHLTKFVTVHPISGRKTSKNKAFSRVGTNDC